MAGSHNGLLSSATAIRFVARGHRLIFFHWGGRRHSVTLAPRATRKNSQDMESVLKVPPMAILMTYSSWSFHFNSYFIAVVSRILTQPWHPSIAAVSRCGLYPEGYLLFYCLSRVWLCAEIFWTLAVSAVPEGDHRAGPGRKGLPCGHGNWKWKVSLVSFILKNLRFFVFYKHLWPYQYIQSVFRGCRGSNRMTFDTLNIFLDFY